MNHSWPFLALMVLVTKDIVWSRTGASLVSWDWKKAHLTEGEIFWGNQQPWKDKRGQQKKVENIRGLWLKHAEGIPLCTLFGQMTLLLLSSPSWIFTAVAATNTLTSGITAPAELYLRPLCAIAGGKHRAVVLSSFGWKIRLGWLEAAVSCRVPAAIPAVSAGLGICHLRGSLQLGVARDKVVSWNPGCCLIFIEETMFLERKGIWKTTSSEHLSILLGAWARLGCFRHACVSDRFP